MKKEWRLPTLWIALFPLIMAVSCGINDFGVLSIDFDLKPTSIEELPEGLNADDFADLNLAHGTVHVDVLEGIGESTTEGLPGLPDGFVYEVLLQLAHHERDGLEPGDHHGVEHGEEGDGPHDEGDLETISIGEMMSMGDSRMIDFNASHMDHHPMGAIRAAMVVIEPPEGEQVMVLFGRVEITDDGSDEGGHEHGA